MASTELDLNDGDVLEVFFSVFTSRLGLSPEALAVLRRDVKVAVLGTIKPGHTIGLQVQADSLGLIHVSEWTVENRSLHEALASSAHSSPAISDSDSDRARSRDTHERSWAQRHLWGVRLPPVADAMSRM